MRTDFDIANNYKVLPTIFRADFNNSATINANQAWSLFFTAGRDDAALGYNPEVGQFFNNILIAVVGSFVVGTFLYPLF